MATFLSSAPTTASRWPDRLAWLSRSQRCIAVLCCVPVALAAGASPIQGRLELADAVINNERQAQQIPGVAVAVIEHGQVVFARGYGYANVEHDVPVTTETVFQSGSVGKQFTAAAVMFFVEDGRLSLDDSIKKYLPEAPNAWNAVRIRHLLTHTSGIPDYANDSFDYRRAYTEDELVRMACALPLEFTPGQRYNYSNTGYLLLGVILGRIGARHYSEVLRDRIFEPLGMHSARLIDEAAIVMHRAAGYRLLNGKLANQEWVSPELNTTADGALYLSLNDMIAWDRGVREGKILKPASWREAFTPVKLNSGNRYPYDFGWEVLKIGGRTVAFHDGGWQGFATHISRYLDDDLSIIILTNLAQGDPQRIARRVAAAMRDNLALPSHAAIADAEPGRLTELRRLLKAGSDGTLTSSDLPHIRGGFPPSIAISYRKELHSLGNLKSLSLFARTRMGDDERSEYLAEFAQGRRVVTYTVDPQGNTAELEIGPAD